MAMIIIINDNEDDNDDLMKVLCAHTLLMMMDCTLSWFHKTPFIKLHTVQMLHIVPGTQCSYLHNVQRLYICKKIYTSHGRTQQTIAQCAWLSGAHSCTALRARKLAQKNIFTQFIWSRFPSRQTHWVLFISLNNFDSIIVSQWEYYKWLNSETSTIHKSMLCLEVSVQSDSHLWMDLFQVRKQVVCGVLGYRYPFHD